MIMEIAVISVPIRILAISVHVPVINYYMLIIALVSVRDIILSWYDKRCYCYFTFKYKLLQVEIIQLVFAWLAIIKKFLLLLVLFCIVSVASLFVKLSWLIIVDPCTEYSVPFNNTLPRVYVKNILQVTAIVNQCQAENSNFGDASNLWYQASAKPNCTPIAESLKDFPGKLFTQSI